MGDIRRALPELTMVNCSQLMDEVRWIKTAGEVAQQKQAADLLDDVLTEIFPTIRDGETEREVHARVIAGLHEARSCLRAWYPELEFERRHVRRRK